MSPTRDELAARLRQAAPMVKPMAVRGILPAWIAEVVLQAAEALSPQGKPKPVAWVFTDHLERMKTWNGSTGEMRLWRYAPTLNKGYTPLYTAPLPPDALPAVLAKLDAMCARLNPDGSRVADGLIADAKALRAALSERGEHMEAAASKAPEHVSASAPRKDAGAAASASLGASVEMRVAGEPLPAPAEGWSSVGPELLAAAKRVLAHLDARIDLAPSSATPVFDGIADLHDAIGRAEALSRPAPKGEDGR